MSHYEQTRDLGQGPEPEGPSRWLPRSRQRISGAETLPPFFMSLASPSDHWMFLSSLGSLTAGRRSIDRALFPYRTVDQIHDAAGKEGGRMLLRRRVDGVLWEPFTESSQRLRAVSRSIERTPFGTSVTFVERSEALGLEARQTWTTSERSGILRFSSVENIGSRSAEWAILDGVVDVLPALVDPGMQQRLSSLVEAYRRAEWTGSMALFSLGSVPVDRAEPAEALRASTAWTTAPGTVLLSERQLEAFRQSGEVEPEARSRGTRGAFLVARPLDLLPGERHEAGFAFEVHQDPAAVEQAQARLAPMADPLAALLAEAEDTELQLAGLLWDLDAVQRTSSMAQDSRHYSNTLYNAMRGGLPVAEIAPLPPSPEEAADADAWRRAAEELPIGFSRRHGDPSRPWNAFWIDVRDQNGELKAGYQGNWRDIFQNWEALGVSYPALLLRFVVRFLNASTADGYNPYRIDQDGMDWEVEDPDDPWSHIGYWGDHQIVYLTRLLERLGERFPGALAELGQKPLFVFADVPYRIHGFEELVRDPRNSVTFDHDRAALIAARIEAGTGADAKLLTDGDGTLLRASLTEKLLIPVATKLSNLVPGAGIWMNTQRPEWNDANNALAGYGASVVSAAALYRHLGVLGPILAALAGSRGHHVASRTARWISESTEALEMALLPDSDGPASRWRITEALGRAGERYRSAVYGGTGTEPQPLDHRQVSNFLDLAHRALGGTLHRCRREGGLFHGYRLLRFEQDAIHVDDLPLMLEGQMALCASGYLEPEETVALLDALASSELYREDVRSYLLYPDRELPGLLEKGLLDEASLKLPLVERLIAAGDERVVRKSPATGTVRFAPDFRSAADLAQTLEALRSDWTQDVERDRPALLAAYERSFQHQSFTGRSGSFFGYEGLGCIYWHMVSKLALAVQEAWFDAKRSGANPRVLDALARHYRSIKEGIGAQKSPDEYGAFPSEPYSHTPGSGGVRQPGMTGQVKEDLLARLGELGLRADAGRLHYDPSLLDAAEFCEEETSLPTPSGPPVPLAPGSLGFTHCGVPFVAIRQAPTSDRFAPPQVTVHWADGREESSSPEPGEPLALTPAASRALWSRSGEVTKVTFTMRPR